MSILENTTKKATQINPRQMVIFSYPKIGKTEMCTQLPGKYLILDFEKGTDYFDSEAISINDLATLDEVTVAMAESKAMYDFIVLDTLTSLYDKIINELAVRTYNKAEGTNKSLSWDIRNLAYGAGYMYKRNALQKIINFFQNHCKTLIILGHVADKAMTNDTGDNMQIKDLDIEGKLKNILAAKVDVIALLTRTKEGNVLSFNTNKSATTGSRVKHLSGKEILISELDEEGNLITHWDKIFISEN